MRYGFEWFEFLFECFELAFEWFEFAFECFELAFEWFEFPFKRFELAFELFEFALEWFVRMVRWNGLNSDSNLHSGPNLRSKWFTRRSGLVPRADDILLYKPIRQPVDYNGLQTDIDAIQNCINTNYLTMNLSCLTWVHLDLFRTPKRDIYREDMRTH